MATNKGSGSVLGIEVGAFVLRAVVMSAGQRVLQAAAEVNYSAEVEERFSPEATRQALKDVMYQLGHLVPGSMQAAVSIGPPNAGVGSGSSLPSWLEHRARFLEEDLKCGGDQGIAFSPSGPVDDVVSLCADVGVMLRRVDLAPVAAERLLAKGACDNFTVGSGVGWQAGVRGSVVLAAVESSEVSADAPMTLIQSDKSVKTLSSYHQMSISKQLSEQFDLDLAQLAPAVGAAVGLISGAPGDLMNGFTVVGRSFSGNPLQNRETAGPTSEQGGPAGRPKQEGKTGPSERAQAFDTNLQMLMPFPVTDTMSIPERPTPSTAVERLGGHGIAGKSSNVDAMVDTGMKQFAAMSVIFLLAIVAIAAVVTLR